MNRPVLLDSSFLIALERETARREEGPASRFLATLRGRSLVVSVVSVAEVLEGAADEDETLGALQRFSIQALLSTHARRCALLQRRCSKRLCENDAWLVATAETLDADILGSDRAAFRSE